VSVNIDEIDKLLGTYARCWNARDLDGVMAFYAADAAYLAPDREVVRGRAAIKTTLERDLGSAVTDLTFEASAGGHSETLAYSLGRYRGMLAGPGGRRTVKSGKYLFVFRRDPDGQWRAVADAFSANAPEGSTP
jgi:ketosteroid isomerase-like protein